MSRNKHRRYPPFVAISRKTLQSPEWRTQLTRAERDVYEQLKARYVGHNNGEIILSYKALMDFMSPATIAKAFKGLEKKGWVERTHVGGLYRFVNKYRLTWAYDDAYPKYGL